MTRFLLIAILALVVGYGLIEAYPLLSGPTLSISSPAAYADAPGGILTVSGKSLRAASLTLDGAPVLPGQDGSFSVALTLPPGGSILTLTATDRFGRSITKTRTVYVP